MVNAAVPHARGLEDLLLHVFLELHAGDLFHGVCEQHVVDVGIRKALARSAGGRLSGFPEQADDLAVGRDPLFPVKNGADQILDVKIGHAAGVGQQMPERNALVGVLRKILGVFCIKAQLALPHQEHDCRRREHFADGSHFKNAVLRHRELILRVAEAESALAYDLAVLGVEPGAVERTILIGRAGQVFYGCFLIHALHSPSCFLQVKSSYIRQPSPNFSLSIPPLRPNSFSPMG